MNLTETPPLQPFFGTVTENINFANMCVLGVPRDLASSYRLGAAEGPKYIRYATSLNLYNPYTEHGVNLQERWQLFDIGDAEVSELEVQEAHQRIYNKIAKNNKYNMRFLFLGGDHLTTYFTFTSLKKIAQQRMGLIYLDAHPDLYENYAENKYSHACVVKRIIDETNIEPEAIFQVGIRANTTKQQELAEKLGITTITTQDIQTQKEGGKITAKRIKETMPKKIDGIYLSVDLDVLDPAYAPGIGNPEPGGLSTRELIQLIQELTGIKILAVDIVELCPKYDYSSITSFAAAKIIKEILGIM